MEHIVFSSVMEKGFAEASPISLLFGHGPGTAELLMTKAFGFTMLPHNDHLKIFYEYGAIGAFLVYFALWKLIGVSRTGVYLLAYIFIIFITDNVFIYYYFLFTCIMLSHVRDEPMSQIREQQPAGAGSGSACQI